MPRTKAGEKITWGEFGKRWKRGMKGVTPLQQANLTMRGTWIMLLGLACGFVITLFNLRNLWWLSIILGAGFFNTTVSLLGLWQKVQLLKQFEIPMEVKGGFENE